MVGPILLDGYTVGEVPGCVSRGLTPSLVLSLIIASRLTQCA
jgi:hypothetical protein